MKKNRSTRAVFLASSLFPSLWLLGCSLFDTALNIGVVIPAPPEFWREKLPGLGFSLLYPDFDGRLQWMCVTDFHAPVALACSKRRNAPVLAYPWSSVDGSCAVRGALRPAGGLFPRDLRQGETGLELVLSWEDGAVAEVFRTLWESGLDTGRINGERLAERMRGAPDPWAWDIVSIAQALASGEFTAYDVDPLPVQDVRLFAPEGEWFLESPFRPSLGSGPDGDLLVEGLSYGLHHLFGGDRRIDVFLDARGASTVSTAEGSEPP
jgi:hypothetical protein